MDAVTSRVSTSARTALITGVSNPRGIAAAVARRILIDGGTVFAHTWPHDTTGPYETSLDHSGTAVDLLRNDTDRFDHLCADFRDADAPSRVVAAAFDRFPGVDALIITHARSSSYALADTSPAELDAAWAVNVRAAVLLVKEFAARRQPDGRVVLFTSGQHKGPMPSEIPYAATKGALHQFTATLSDAVIDLGITVNCVNPGPTDTGWASSGLKTSLAQRFPSGRWNTADDTAGVVAMLISPDAATITGQVIDAERGFRR